MCAVEVCEFPDCTILFLGQGGWFLLRKTPSTYMHHTKDLALSLLDGLDGAHLSTGIFQKRVNVSESTDD